MIIRKKKHEYMYLIYTVQKHEYYIFAYYGESGTLVDLIGSTDSNSEQLRIETQPCVSNSDQRTCVVLARKMPFCETLQKRYSLTASMPLVSMGFLATQEWQIPKDESNEILV